tara:strand:+ start:488 stop:1135 length:648 start_codon:yes stop_codon:yes gene_type:complete
MEKSIILMAAGTGERMNSDIPKQFIEVNGLPIIIHTYNVFKKIDHLNIYIVLPKTDFNKWSNYINKFIEENDIIVQGGDHRNISVRNGVNAIKSKNGLIGIHDGVRPFLSTKLINSLFAEAEKNGNAIPFTQTINSLRKIDGNKNFSVDRSKYVQIQTPQIFEIKLIKDSLNSIEKISYTDEASLIEELGLDINLVEGEEENIKITTKKDLNYFN